MYSKQRGTVGREKNKKTRRANWNPSAEQKQGHFTQWEMFVDETIKGLESERATDDRHGQKGGGYGE